MEKESLIQVKPVELIDLNISNKLLGFLKVNFSMRTLKELSRKTENEIRNGISFNPDYLEEINSLLLKEGLSLKKEN